MSTVMMGEKSVNNIPAFQTSVGDGVLDTQYYLYDISLNVGTY